MTIALIIAGITLFLALIAFASYSIKKISDLYDKVLNYQEKYQKEFELANKLATDGLSLADENRRLKATVTSLETQYDRLIKETKFTDPAAAISNELRGFKPSSP